jgi:sigma-E factor negative regulatory protein RseC
MQSAATRWAAATRKQKKLYLCTAKKTTMETETISHEGVVTKITDDELEIKILAQSACAACHAKSACGMGEQAEKILTVLRPKDKEFTLMQKVNVKMAIGQGNKAAILAYLIPIILLLAVLFVCLGLGVSEGLSALISIVALIPYYIGLYLQRDKLKKKFDYTID